MTTFPVHSLDTAPDASKPILAAVQKSFGFVPNLYRVMAEAPAAVEAYASLMDIFGRTSFTATEKQTVLLSVSYVNGCEYCVAAHSTVAAMQKVPAKVIESLRNGTPIEDPRLEALARLTREIVETRGWPSEEAKSAFTAAGFTAAQYLEVVLGVSMKTLSNYINHAADTPLDDAFSSQEWAA